MANIVSIDLGTTNSVVVIEENGNNVPLKFKGKYIYPSCFYKNNDLQLTGFRAKNRGKLDPVNFVSSSKRFMGDPTKEYIVSGKVYHPEDIAVEILKDLKNEASEYLHDDDLKAIITVPNNYPTSAVESTKNAGNKAGFSEVKILKEPIAAALAYRDMIETKEDRMIAVCDFGGGTYDIAVISYSDGNYEVIASGGDSKLGGNDFDDVLYQYIVDDIKQSIDYDFLDFSGDHVDENSAKYFDSDVSYLKAKAKIRDASERVKEDLSSLDHATISIANLYVKDSNSINYEKNISRKEFYELPEVKRLFRRFEESTDDVMTQLKKQNISTDMIDYVVFAGGSMNIPMCKDIIKRLLKSDILDQNLDTVVAIGAKRSEEAVHIIPKLNYALCTKVKGDSLEVIIDALSKYPVKKSKFFTTDHDGQKKIEFAVVEGNDLSNAYSSKNHFLGYLTINVDENMKAGEPNIELTYELDGEGILHISAVDNATNNTVTTELNWKELKG